MNQTTHNSWRVACARALRRVPALAAVLGIVATSGLALSASVQAASQNELAVTRLFDGTAAFTKDEGADPIDNGTTAPAPHTPGQDSGSTNNVVRTNDLYGLRIDWDVNEANATNVVLTVTLPSHSTWAPDASGMFAGCDPAKSTIVDQVLTCWLGDTITQGSHGVLRPIAVLHSATNNDVFNVTATLTTGQDPTGISDQMDWPLTVSEAPVADWIKYKPTIELIKDASGKPDAYIAMYPLGLSDYSQKGTPQKGAGAIDPNTPITFYDHAWNLADGTTLASAADVAKAGFAGSEMGPYAQGGALPVTVGDWSFSDATPAGNPYGYKTYQLTATNFSNVPPATNANGSANTSGVILTGQIAFRLPYAAVQADIAASLFGGVEYTNLISSNPPTDNMASGTIIPIPITGSSVTPEVDVDNNAVLTPISNSGNGGTSPGADGSYQYHYANIAPTATTEKQARIVDLSRAVNGIPRVSTTDVGYFGSAYFDGRGEISRGTPVNLEMFVSVITTTSSMTTPIHGCMTWDPSQLFVTPMPDVYNWEFAGGSNSVYSAKPPTGYFEDVAFGTSGGSPVRGRYARPTTYALSPSDIEDIGLVVEYAYDPSANVAADNQANGDVECNNSSARTWVPSTDIAAMQAYRDTSVPFERYTFNMVRVRTKYFPWARLYKGAQITSSLNFPGTAGMFISVSAMLGIDKDINYTGKSVYIHSGRASGTWKPNQADPATYAPNTENCYPDPATDDTSLDYKATKWCSQPYAVAAENTTDPYSSLDKGNFQSVNATANIDSDTDRVTIVDVRPNVNKRNVDGIFDVKDNGQLVQFDLDVSAVGAKTEALTDVTLSDPLPAYYKFVRFVTQPATSPDLAAKAPACSFDPTSGPQGTIKCRFSEEPGTGPVPADVTDLPEALPGGWSDTFRIEVQVIGAIANANTYKPLTNTATLSSQAFAPWDPTTGNFLTPTIPATELPQKSVSSARSYMPYANDYAYSGKTIDGSGGPCRINLLPNEMTLTEWQTRCSMIGYDGDASNTTTTDTSGNIKFTLNYTNDGNTALKNIAFVDVLPYNGDSVSEPGSSSGQFGANPPTIGDARSPGSRFSGKVGFVSAAMSPESTQNLTTQYFTKAAPKTVPRDPLASWTTVAWCDAAGTVVNGVAGSCPANPFEVTAVYLVVDQLNPDATLGIDLTVDTEGASCTDTWTNTAGARSDNMNLPVRTNDVTAMVGCKYDLALQKRLSPKFDSANDPTWATPGVSVVPFDIEVINQGQGAANDFTITDYVDTTRFKFEASKNPAGKSIAGTLGSSKTGPALPYTWKANSTKPAVSFDGILKPGESTIVTVYLTVTVFPSDRTFTNWAEISKWDNDGNSANGSSVPSDLGSLVDIDSTPDTINGNDKLIDNAIDLTPATGDEDDHDIAKVKVTLPKLDLALRKTLAAGQDSTVHKGDLVTFNITVFNQGKVTARDIGLIDYIPPQLQLADSDWKSTSASTATYTFAGPLLPGRTAVVPITLKVLKTGAIDNYAEITGQTPISSTNQVIVDENGKPITDIDSTPDTRKNNDKLIDNVINKTPATGDEDDHDIASLTSVEYIFDLALRKTIADGNPSPVMTNDLVTFNITVFNQGEVDATDIGLIDYLPPQLELADSDWTAGPNNTATTTIPGPLKPGESIVVPITVRVVVPGKIDNYAEITKARPTDPDGKTLTTDDGKELPDVDSTPDTDNTNDKLIDNEINKTPATGDEDDHDIAVLEAESPMFDLALRKTLLTNLEVNVGDLTTYQIEVFNQGEVEGRDITITDYLPNGTQLEDADWTAGPNNTATYVIAGPIKPGTSVKVPITVRITTSTAGDYINTAEISKSRPTWPDGKTVVGPDGKQIEDKDSVADDNPNNDILIDDEINNAGGDEDDHDIARIIVKRQIPSTGSQSQSTLMWAGAFAAGGLGLLSATRRRRRRSIA